MAKLAALPKRPPTAAIKTRSKFKPDTITHEGGAGFSRKPKSELFLLAVTNMVGEKTFYEDATDRDARFEALISQVALADPDWIARFVPYLRNTMNMRSASIVMAAELVHTKLTQPVAASTITNRTIVRSAIARADEMAEFIGYWRSRFGKSLPMPVKRGIADAAVHFINERNAIKWDGQGKPIRFADILDIVHPTPVAPWQATLWKHLLDERHGHATEVPEALTTLRAYRTAQALEGDAFRSSFPEVAEHFTWETASSKYGKLDAAFWQALVPHMGYMALLRNLRNLDGATVDETTIEIVRKKLRDPDEVAKSRQFPMRFLSAWKTVVGMRWAETLETALGLSVLNVPELRGRTLVLVDVSGSMAGALSAKSDLARWEAAAVFGAALAVRNDGDLVTFDTTSRKVPAAKGGSILRVVDVIRTQVGGGTNTVDAVLSNYKGHDRIVILTDEQAFSDARLNSVIGLDVPIYTYNLAGYKAAHLPSGGKRYTFGGLSDAAFTAMDLLERDTDSGWPF
jgi:hypothetical protein